ncbi:MAG TPA: phosphatase PAP2 family protein, partial [Halococcus sp.]|nr:phosphatase PAP2 family protein [Halococcus sp.]
MVPVLPATTEYMLLVVVASLITMGVCTLAFMPRLRPVAFVKGLVYTDWKYIGVAWIVTAGVNALAHQFHAPQTFTWIIYELEGATVGAFQTIASPFLTTFFTAVYLAGLPTIVLFTYFKLKAHDEREARRYALGYVALVLLALPFFIFIPVGIPALYAPVDIKPLVFTLSPVIQTGMLATDTMVKAFPSLHTGLSVLAALYARKADQKYAIAASVFAGTIVLSTFYLGIHWLSDAVFAVVLVWVAYRISRRIDPEWVFPVPV